MDVETASALERLTVRIDSLETSLRGDIARLDVRFDQVDARFEQVDARFEQQDGRFSSLRADIEEVRRHAVLLNEATRDDIRMVAEAVAVLTVKVDALRR